MNQHQITYTGYTIGDKVWVWAYWIPLVTEAEIVGITLERYPEEPDKLEVYYRVNVQNPNGETDQHSFSGEDLHDTKIAALEAAVEDQEKLVTEWREDVNKQETALGCLKQELLMEQLANAE